MPRDHEALYAAIGARIKARRREVGLTQPQVAEQMGTYFRNIQRLERGANMTLRTLSRLAEVLGVSVRELLP